MRDNDVGENVSTGKHNLQIGSAPVLHMQTLRLTHCLSAHDQHGVVQRVHHGVVARGDLRPRLRLA